MQLKVGKKIKLLIDYKHHKKGHIGTIYKMSEDKQTAYVDLSGEGSPAQNVIIIHKKDEVTKWEFAKGE